MNTTITDLLQDKSNIKDTPFEELINNTIGYFFELIETDTENLKNGMFLNTADGEYLDLWGIELGIKRIQDESDEDYFNRLFFLPTDKLTPELIYTVYDLQLISYDSDADNLTLLSDNHFINNKYYVDCSDSVWEQLSKKFIVEGVLYRWSE